MRIIIIVLSPLIYLVTLLIPKNKKLWVFGSWFGLKFSDNTKPVYEYVDETLNSINAVWITKNREIVNELKLKGRRVLYAYSLAGIYAQLRASAFFMTVNSNDFYFATLSFRVKQYQLWHGVPLKKIGLDSLAGIDKIISQIRSLLIDRYTFVISPFPDMDKNYMTAFGLPASKILRSESPRCDNFFLPVEEKALIRSQLGFDSEYKNVIYMPTHRCEGRCPEKLQGLIEEILKIDEFLCMNKIRIYIKPHFYEKGIALDDVVAKSVFLVSDETADLYKILTVTDALITDYSSVVFDYCLLNRPILFFMPDMDDYFINDREAYFQPNEISDRFNRSSEDLKVDLQKVFGGLSSGSFKLHSPGFDLTAKYQISSRLVSEIICEENAL